MTGKKFPKCEKGLPVPPEGEQVVNFAVCVRTSVGCLLIERERGKKGNPTTKTACKDSTACTVNIANYWAKSFIWPLGNTRVMI